MDTGGYNNTYPQSEARTKYVPSLGGVNQSQRESLISKGQQS